MFPLFLGASPPGCGALSVAWQPLTCPTRGVPMRVLSLGPTLPLTKASTNWRGRARPMTYVKPPAFTRRVVNPIVAKLNPGGVATLTVPGRRSGRAQRVPVIPVTVDDTQYLVSPYGDSQWVRNLRASGVAELSRRGQMTVVARAVEVPVAERAPIIAAYRKAANRAVDSFFTRRPDPRDHPVFQLTSANAPPAGKAR